LRTIYFPLCGVDAQGIKSSITPRLSGDIKLDKNRYLTKPVSSEDLRQNMRDFFCTVDGKGFVSLAGENGQNSTLEAGMFWHKHVRIHDVVGLQMEALNFVPISGEQVELMRVTVRNTGEEPRCITPTFSLPIFARALANKHDHEHVTSLFNRIEQLPNGVCVEPTMIFDERGHQPNKTVYYCLGVDAKGKNPIGTFPTAESFYGDGGCVATPEAVIGHRDPEVLAPEALAGKEAVGALRFADEKLAPGEDIEYLIIIGIGSDREEMHKAFNQFNTPEKFDNALEQNKSYWLDKSRAIHVKTGDKAFDAWMQWVTLQPVLRRIFGCSFLPDHDYGKGGKGWRDIWQDLLSLILIEPENIRDALINNFSGVRMDGSNATIIGSVPGEFIADRNAIARVWMDHGVWPLTTLLLYVHQTGDYDILFEDTTFFSDGQMSRTCEKDDTWTSKNGNLLKDKHDQVYEGSVIEHVLIQHLVQFFNVGEHNIIRLEDADWNDGLDMAKDRGESVTFMSFYGGNLLALADLLENCSAACGRKEITLAAEVKVLLDSLSGSDTDYDHPQAKEKFLFETYFPSVQPHPSGEQVMVSIKGIVEDLRKKGNWIFCHIRTNEMITIERDGIKNSWFNGYYDNEGERVEGVKEGDVYMTLVGQVFPLMSGLAKNEDITRVIESVQRYLRDEKSGGFRLNTNFNRPHYLDLGRAFAFAYGTKENGAFFSHMNVMYAYALYVRGFVQEGHDVLRSIYRMCMDTEKSKIYPGIPEYFDSQGRGRYHYLTGAASWLVLTQLNQVFGVRGDQGDLLIHPKLVLGEFDPKEGIATVSCYFAGKRITVTYENPDKCDYGAYVIKEVLLNEERMALEKDAPQTAKIKRELIKRSSSACTIRVVLGSCS